MDADTNSLFIPECVTVEQIITVPKEIPALSLVPAGDGARLGQIVPLPKGSRLEVCGHGFNLRTIKARCEGRFYFVFLQDLGLSESFSTTAAGSGSQ